MTDINKIDMQIIQMAQRIRELREIEGLSIENMAALTGLSVSEYIECENGKSDLNFAFLYRCASALRVDVTDIIKGSSPRLSSMIVTRKGAGQRIEKAHGMTYHNLAARFKNRIAEPLYVCASYSEDALNKPIELTTHVGQECDIVISGKLKVQVGDHTEILEAGDTVYYDSSTPHGMIAVGGEDCYFYAIVLSPINADLLALNKERKTIKMPERDGKVRRIYHDYVVPTKDENGIVTKVEYKNTENFNFAFDIVDGIARRQPDKLAMLHVDINNVERRFTFKDIKDHSNQCANYFKSLGIKKGDRVMMVLKRHYQFWFAMMALNKIGAIAIPATNQLLAKDFDYRFNAAGVSAILCTADGDTANQVDIAAENAPTLVHKIMVGGTKEGWLDFDSSYPFFSRHFERSAIDCPCGDDLLLMFFTSGTTGYPKIAAHSHKYPLGHFITAKYWHCVNPDGLHFTISDTGWAKSMWGKLYGQWLCEAPIFVYDFDRFHASDILPMFAKYNITTFCAPPTMYRMLIKDDLSKYDLSSIQHASTAGEALNPEVYYQFKKATGLEIMEGFGQSESTVMLGNLAGMDHKIGSMGKPVQIYDIQLLDPEGNPVGVGESGEICVNVKDGAPCGLFVGYYRDEEKTKEVWHDGYYHTGDVAWRDEDGFYWYVGRADDVIKSSGYRIGPFEIESVLMELPYILECGVTGTPDEIRGQVVKASIVLVKGTEGTEELKKEIQEYVKKRTAPYKYPRVIEFKDELPKTVSGKIIRNQL